MKILCNFGYAGPSYVRSAWGRVFQAIGHEFHFWYQDKESAFDVFNRIEPDIYLGCTYEISRAVYKCIAKRPNMKVGLFASAWGPYLNDIDLKVYPLVVANEQEKRNIENLKKETGRPDFVFIHAHDKWLEGTMSGWSDIGVKYIGLLNAADWFVYNNGQKRKELECDIGFVGGYWGYKAKNLDKYMLPLCHQSKNLNIKIFGNQKWPVSQFVGACSDIDSRDLFASATVCPNISEPHSTDYGFDVIERVYKVPLAGGFCISDYVEEARDLFTEDELPMGKSPQQLEEMVRYFIKYPEEREPYKEKMKKRVLHEHTYFERVYDMLENFGMSKECSKLLKIKGQIICQ